MSLAGVRGAASAPPARSTPPARVATAGFRAPPPRPVPAPAPAGLGHLPLGPLGQRSSGPPTIASVPPRAALAPSPRPRPADDDEDLDTVDDATHRRLSFEPGAVVHDRYVLRRPLGDGALGASWLAHDPRANADVVLKVVGDMLVVNDRERAELVGKLGMFAGRSLPGVVMPREALAVPGSVVVVYPHVEAASLRAVIDARHGRGARFTPEECLRVAQALVASVQAMHSASPHGALWPQNVLVTARGLLLVDGFLATSVAPDRLAARVEHHPAVTPFCAPEITAGRRPTASADLYGVGAILAELAGGAPPGSGPELAAVSHDLHRAVATLLDREPARRPAGIRMVLDALTAAAGFAQRPSEAPLPLPEAVLAAESAAPEAPQPEPPPPEAPRASEVVIFATHAPPAPAPPAAEPAAEPADGPPGRLRGPTATLPLASARTAAHSVQSGPPPSLAVKSGPPQPVAPQPVAPQPVAPQPVAPQPVAPRPLPAASSVAPKPPAAAAPVASKPPSAPAVAPAPAASKPSQPAAPIDPAKSTAPRPVAPSARPFPIPSAPAALTGDAPADPRTAFKTLPSINEAARAPKPLTPRAAPASGLPPRPATSPLPPAPAASPPAPAASPPRPAASALPPAPRPPLPRPPPPAPPRAATPPPTPAASRPPPPAPPAPSRLPPRPAAQPAARDRGFDDDAIDPKLLRVARMLDDERRRDQSGEAPPPGAPRGRPPAR